MRGQGSEQHAWAVQGGKAAATTILDMRATGDFSKQSTKEYQRRWMEAYGHDFGMVRALPSPASSPRTGPRMDSQMASSQRGEWNVPCTSPPRAPHAVVPSKWARGARYGVARAPGEWPPGMHRLEAMARAKPTVAYSQAQLCAVSWTAIAIAGSGDTLRVPTPAAVVSRTLSRAVPTSMSHHSVLRA